MGGTSCFDHWFTRRSINGRDELISMRLVAAPDKYRSTATAQEIATAIMVGAHRVGWRATHCPLADGGEGLLDLVGGEVRSTPVRGPLGETVIAEWRLIADVDAIPTAIIEMAAASGINLVGGPEGNDPERASTFGTGELIGAAVAAGAQRVVVGCGGSATTDGGQGALNALADLDLSEIEIIVASDTEVRFLDAAAMFAPQKGADSATVARLSGRLVNLADTYRVLYGVDVSAHSRTGAGGGLSGALFARGAVIVSGFDYVAKLVNLDAKLSGSDLVITGEGRFDISSLRGKVVGGVIEKVAGRAPVLVIAGSLDPEARHALPPNIELVALADRFGITRSLADPLVLISEVVAEYCANVSK